jgi:hypothetical protein
MYWRWCPVTQLGMLLSEATIRAIRTPDDGSLP